MSNGKSIEWDGVSLRPGEEAKINRRVKNNRKKIAAKAHDLDQGDLDAMLFLAESVMVPECSSVFIFLYEAVLYIEKLHKQREIVASRVG